MRLISVLLVMALAGCTTAPFKVFLGDYKKEGMTSSELAVDRNFCSKEALKFKMNTPAMGDLSNFYMQKFMLKCMKDKGYEPVDIHPEAFDDPFQMGKQ